VPLHTDTCEKAGILAYPATLIFNTFLYLDIRPTQFCTNEEIDLRPTDA
jgi:hypothetical protein